MPVVREGQNRREARARRRFPTIVISTLTAVFLGLLIGCLKSPSDPNTQIAIPMSPIHSPGSAVRLNDVARSSGVSWVARNGEDANLYSLLESFGSGCAIDDFDRDGMLDLMIGGGGRFSGDSSILPLPIAFYRQVSDWSFVDVAPQAWLEPIRHYHHGLWTVDQDEDGFSDLLITGWSGLQLFRNQGDGTFDDVTDRAGLRDPMWSVAAAWADLNQDQILDLFVGHYADWSIGNNPVCYDRVRGARDICDPTRFNGLPCTVYLGRGDGTYRDAGEELGIHGVGKTLGVVIADVNDDDRPDIYVANDTLPNQLYLSSATGRYREAGVNCGVALGDRGAPDGSMGVDAADIDGDGKIDLCVANYENQSFALYRNAGPEIFTHASLAFGLTAVGAEAVGFGTVVLDVDGDGRPDLFCSNGHVHPPSFPGERRQCPYLFWNEGGKRLRNIAMESGDYLPHRHLGRGAATGDLDANGTPDLLVTHTNEPVALLKNDTEISNWLAVRLVGRASPRSAVGARVLVTAGSLRQVGLVKGGSSYLSSNDPTILFGLGKQERVDTLEVHWPSGAKTTRTHVSANQRLLLVEETTPE